MARVVADKMKDTLGQPVIVENRPGAIGRITAEAVKNAKAGQVQYRTDKGGIVQCTIGRASFGEDALKENLLALVDALNKAKPAASKGVYLKKLAISSTMGVGVRVDQSTLAA